MNPKQFNAASEHVPDAPPIPAPAPQGHDDKLMAKIRAQAPHLLTRHNFILVHERTCASGKGLLCDCDVRACVDGSTLRLRD